MRDGTYGRLGALVTVFPGAKIGGLIEGTLICPRKSPS